MQIFKSIKYGFPPPPPQIVLKDLDVVLKFFRAQVEA